MYSSNTLYFIHSFNERFTSTRTKKISNIFEVYFCLFCVMKYGWNKNSAVSSVLVVNMAGSIKIFQLFRKCHQTIGIHPPQPNQKQPLINWIKWIFVILQSQFLFAMVAFLVFDAESMFDYGLAFFLLISIMNTIVVSLIFIWQTENTEKFIKNCEEFIAESKCRFLLQHLLRLKIVMCSFNRSSFNDRLSRIS